MTKANHETTAKAVEKLQAKDADGANNDSARTNEILAQRADAGDSDPVATSLALNDPSLTRNAHTSHESGFNEELQAKHADDVSKHGEVGAKHGKGHK